MKRFIGLFLCAAMLLTFVPQVMADTAGVTYTKTFSSGTSLAGAVKETPAKFLFTVSNDDKNREYILVDEYNNTETGKKEYFIVKNTGYAVKPVSSTGKYTWDLKKTETAAGFINADENVGNYVPSGMQTYVSQHSYVLEKGANVTEGTAVSSKYSLLSYNEYIAYQDRIGYYCSRDDSTSYTQWLLRTPHPTRDDYETLLGYNTTTGTNPQFKSIGVSTRFLLRPCFYITEDFFKNIKVKNAGSEVIKAIVAAGNDNGVYTDDEWNSFVSKDISSAISGKIQITSNGKVKSGYTLTAADVTASDNIVESAAKVEYIVSGDGETWASLDEGKTYTITNACAGKYICAVAEMADGTMYVSNSVQVGANLTHPIGWGKAPDGIKAYADAGDRFYFDVDGYNSYAYTLLKSENGKTLLFSDRLDTEPIYNSSDVKQIYDVTDPNSIAYVINQAEFLTANILPEKYHNYIENNMWETEYGYTDSMANDTVTEAKLALPSMTELCKYADKIGYNEGSNGIKLRTPYTNYNASGNFEILLVSSKGTPSASIVNSTSTFYPNRVEFYINNDAFKTLKIDAKKSGVKTLRAINLPGILTESEAKALGYTDNELVRLGYGDGVDATLSNLHTDGTKIYAELNTVSNSTANAFAVVAIYDGDTLKAVAPVTIALANGETNEILSAAVPSGIKDTDKVRICLWNDTNTMVPLAPVLADIAYGDIATATAISGEVPYSDGMFSYKGRWEDKGTYMLSNWTRPYVDFAVKASELTVNFGSDTTAKTFKIFINGKEVYRGSGYTGTSVDLSSVLASGVNKVRILNEAETTQLSFSGITVDANAKKLDAPANDINVMFIGDSITSATKGYSYLLPTELGYDFTTISRSGIAFLDGNYSGTVKEGALGMGTKFKQMQSLDKGEDAYDFSKSENYDMIFVNIGTNDIYKATVGGVEYDKREEFKREYKNFIEFIAEKYSNAKIYVIKPLRKQSLVAGDNESKNNAYYRGLTFDEIGIEAGTYGDKVEFIDTTGWDINFSSTENIHPSASGHDQIKTKLIDIISK